MESWIIALSHIKNALIKGNSEVLVRKTKTTEEILKVLTKEGFLKGYTEYKNEKNWRYINVKLKNKIIDDSVKNLKRGSYANVIEEIKLLSKPGLKKYCSVKKLPEMKNGLGRIILSTTMGIMTDVKAREMKLGGKLLFKIN